MTAQRSPAHETHHKRRALPLLAQARTLLRPGGQLLSCDHDFDRAEQPEVLRAGGYAHADLLRDDGGMALRQSSRCCTLR
jgi:hypothetical protein